MACKLTLLCPSYERHHYLERSCRFWGDRDGVYVLYADGSQSPLESPVTNAPNLRYLHQPVGLKQRLLGLLDQVQTPYVCMMCDDEFFIPSALQACVGYLESHCDYVSCMGRAIRFSRLHNKISLGTHYPRLKDKELSDIVALNRLNSHFSDYVPAHYYAVTRTDVFRSAIRAAMSIDLDVYGVIELALEMLVVSSGKSVVLPVLYWLRSFEAPPLRNTGDIGLDPSKHVKLWLRSQEAESEKEYLFKFLSMTSCGVVNELEVAQVFNSYYEHAWGNKATRHYFLPYRLMAALPAPLKKPLHSLKARGLMLANQLTRGAAHRNVALQELREQGVMIDEDGLAKCFAAIEGSWGL